MTEKEIEETEVEEEGTGTDQNKNEKTFTQDEVNKLLAKERKTLKAKHDALQTEYNEFKTNVEAAQAKREEKLKSRLEEARKPYPEEIIELLDEKSVEDQLEWIEKHPATPKKKIPVTPEGSERSDSKPEQTPLAINLR